MTPRFEQDRAGLDCLLEHLRTVDGSFQPPLSERVDLAHYAGKLLAHAHREEAWDGEQLIGLVASYCNDASVGCYISNVSLVPAWRGHGVADALVARTLQYAVNAGLRQASLHLHPDNMSARRLYERHGFQVGPQEDERLPMTLNLSTQP